MAAEETNRCFYLGCAGRRCRLRPKSGPGWRWGTSRRKGDGFDAGGWNGGRWVA
jgi:hypothetical protein